ncbi:hypothetical protein IKP94_00320 [Candidatus Saccharibacteria bacterium]|nr:hypothetical protein [Candidatus Saccharibacteria bacterium]
MKLSIVRRILDTVAEVRISSMQFTFTDSFIVGFGEAFICSSEYNSLTDEIEFKLEGTDDDDCVLKSLDEVSKKLKNFPKSKNKVIKKLLKFFDAFDEDADAHFWRVDYDGPDKGKMIGWVRFGCGYECFFWIGKKGLQATFSRDDEHLCSTDDLDKIRKIVKKLRRSVQ